MSQQNIHPTPPFRMVTEACQGRSITGKVLSGGVCAGDSVIFYPCGKRGIVASVPSPAAFLLEEQLTLPPSQVAACANQVQPFVGTRLRAEILQGQTPEAGKSYTLRYGDRLTDVTCEREEANGCCTLKSDTTLIADTEATSPALSGFALLSGGTLVCQGQFLEGLPDGDYDRRNIRLNAGALSRSEREQLTGHQGLVVWMTGLSGAGKSTIAQLVERQLLSEGIPAYLLDGDKLRRGLTADLGFSDADRDENQRRVAETAALFRDAGLVTLVATISPFQRHRALAREKAGGDLIEVYVRADYATCQERDPKQLYQKANAGNIQNFTGKGSCYEVPAAPDVLLDTLTCSPQESAQQLLEAIYRRLGMEHP
ncbi:MAG: adenylyl-sulfate kinase [Oscillospiraceae bacterium]|nr:adenylyl-sulfate kinase [Oscillospiraceae bacterium]